MRGVIILPKYLEKLWKPYNDGAGLTFPNIVSENIYLYYNLRDAMGFEICYADAVDVSSSIDVVCIFSVPYHNRPNLIPGLLDLNKNTKLVTFTGDLQCYNNETCLQNKIKVFDKADIIISFSNEYFTSLYSAYVSKYVFLPKCFAPFNRYAKFELNTNAKHKAILCGSLNQNVYPLRSFVLKNPNNNIDYRQPNHTNSEYVKLLHSYSCGITCASIFNYALAKNFEIPAVGSLLLAPETSDLVKLGFVSGKHYIPITKSNIFSMVNQCVSSPEDFVDIRKEGMKFVRENHSITNRIEQLKKVFDKLGA